jgi:hypothetical protein
VQDHFHVQMLAKAAIDGVRGAAGDPRTSWPQARASNQIRKLLLMASDRLDERSAARLEAALAAGAPSRRSAAPTWPSVNGHRELP